MQVLGVIAVVVALVILGLIALRIAISIALSLAAPLLILAAVIGVAMWWAAGRRGSAGRRR